MKTLKTSILRLNTEFVHEKTEFQKAKNGLKLEKGLNELKGKKLRDKEIIIKKEIEELFVKPISVSTYDMDKFEESEMTKKRSFAKNV